MRVVRVAYVKHLVSFRPNIVLERLAFLAPFSRVPIPRTSQGEEEDAEDVMFSCRLDNAKAITTILSCLSHGTRKDQQAQCEVRASVWTPLLYRMP